MPPHQAVYHTLPGPKPRVDRVPSAEPHRLSNIGLTIKEAMTPMVRNKEADNMYHGSHADSNDTWLAQHTSHSSQQAMRHAHSGRGRRRMPRDVRLREDVLAGLARKKVDSTGSSGEPQRYPEPNDQAQQQKGTDLLFSPPQIHYYHIEDSLVSLHRRRGVHRGLEGHKIESRQRRYEVRHRPRSALEKMRMTLAETLLSDESRTSKTISTADLLASLPVTERPSPSTRIGKFITGLGFYDISPDQISNTKTTKPNKMNTSENVHGTQPLQSPPASDLKAPRALPQSRLKLSPTPRMKAPLQCLTPLNHSIWEQSVNVMTKSMTSDQGDATGGGSASSPHDGGSGPTPNSKAQGDQSTYPGNQPDEQNSQPQNRDMEKDDGEQPPSESEHEDESENDDTDSDTEEGEEQHVPLKFQIPQEALDKALLAPAQTRASYWSQKLYRGPKNEELFLHYCQNMEVSEKVAKYFLNEKVVGFDIEWKVFSPVDSIKENASLIQIACENRIALFHIARFPGKTAEQLMPPTLKAILESPDTIKVGVSIKGDCSRLEKYFDLHIQGVFELSRLYNLVEFYATDPKKVNNKLVNLSRQVQQHLLLPLYKGESLLDEPQNTASVRESDWSRPLDREQIHYAAADAYAGFRLFDVMESKRKMLKPTPPIPRVCDFDAKSAPRTGTKTKRVKKAKVDTAKAVAEALSGLDPEDAEEEEEYETAAEEFVEEDEEESEDTDASFESDFSTESNDPDADYVPKRRGRINLQSLAGGKPASDESPHNVGGADGEVVTASTSEELAKSLSDDTVRTVVIDKEFDLTGTTASGPVDLKQLTSDDPGYPKLPMTASQEEESSSDESDAFDPPPRARRERVVNTSVTKGPEQALSPTPLNESEDEFPDPELEEAFSSMDLGPTSTTSNNIPAEQPTANQSTSDPPISSAPHSPAYALATTWSQSYLTSTIPSPSSPSTSTSPPRIRATIPPLRAYHLWHHQRVPLDAIGAHLREPPLAQSTVCSYIVQAITMEKLEYREADLKELMLELPASLRVGRYGWLSRKLGLGR